LFSLQRVVKSKIRLNWFSCLTPRLLGTKACTTPLKCSSLLIKRKKIQFYLWKPKNNAPAVLKWVLQYMETINKYVWIGMARMEKASDLKTSGKIFGVSALVPPIKSIKTNLTFFSIEMHLIFSPWWPKSNSRMSKVI